jgi:uncharacterized lipoprotein YddW (UPF0748 family)/N-acetylmuramoyl-L-alanine amidase
MKKTLKLTISVVMFVMSMSLLVVTASDDMQAVALQTPELRGVWVATVSNIDYPAHPAADSETLKNEALKILDDAAATGFNAVFLQVRPASDALYKSDYYPWSKYLTGKQGQAPSGGFDPLEFWVSEAHKRGIQLHAWINPYRITKKLDKEPSYDFSQLAPANPAVLHPDWVVKYGDGNLYFNPGIPEVRKLIIDSALEIVENYAVDGIHFDDYFYPGRDFNDKATFAKYGSAYKNIDDWRRANVNTLVGELSKALKSAGRPVRFGISPFGIWANKKTNPLGSDTQGMESYYDHYADTRKWVKEGTIDYIAPQLYWNIGYSIADYGKLLNWWKDTASGTGVDLYIGQAAYRAGNSDPASPWYGVSEIAKQMELNKNTAAVKGSIFFNYTALKDNRALTSVIKAVYERQSGLTAAIPVKLARPPENISTSFKSFYLNGSSDPGKPLYLNGKPVEERSEKGYFGILVPLAEGANVFTVSQEASYSTRVIYRKPAAAVQKMSVAEIPPSSVFPQGQEYRMPGEKITLTCKAPIGSKVTVKLGGKTYSMKPATTKAPGSGAYPTTYTCTYTIPSYKGTPRNIDLGAPAYTMNYKGTVKTRTAPARIGVIMKNSPYYAEAAKAVIDTYVAPESGNGANYELYKGMTDYVTGMTGSYVRLSSGEWVAKSSVRLYTSNTQLKASISRAAYTVGERWDTLKLDVDKPVAALASFDGASLKLSISAASSAKPPVLPTDSLFSKAALSTSDGSARYTLTLKPGQRIEGYYIEKTPDGLTLNIKRHAVPEAGGGALSGITIMVDPGHGGSETGTYGPMGLDYAEKLINLKTALKLKTELENLGAKVLMTRTEDVTLSLADRLAASRDMKPDMFISVHANAMEDNVDISKVYGFSAFYREALAKPLCNTVYNKVLNTLGRNAKGMDKKNFYVMRGTWAPSILVETGFVPNPAEFEWLTDEAEQSRIARTLAEAISDYFNS